MTQIGAPAPRPCASCPYRRDVPSGIWHPEEYAKLAAYDRDTPSQPTQVFLCHQQDATSDRKRVCAGWAGCHDGRNLLSLRFAALTGSMSPEAVEATLDYRPPVPLFRSGAEAARHGLAEVERPGGKAVETMGKIARRRGDLTGGVTMTETPKVRVGQVYADNDKRGYGRQVKVVAIVEAFGDQYAEVVQVFRNPAWDKPGRRSRIRLDRFRPTASGYRLVSDVPEEEAP